MDGGSSSLGAALDEASNANVESPMSNIADDLSRSSLDSGDAKKRHFSRTRGILSPSHRVNNQRSAEGFPYTKDEVYQETKELQNFVRKALNARGGIGSGWAEPSHGRRDCDKENSGATDTLYNRTPQRACNYKRVRPPLENYEENSQDSGHPSSPISERKRLEREFRKTKGYYASLRDNKYASTLDRLFNSCDVAITPIRGGYARSASSSLLRSLSSGYESMDDGIVNELNDMEATNEEEMQLPKGISKLLSGNIVAPETSTDYDVSTTPDFSRKMSSKVKRWLSVQSSTNKRNIKTISPPIATARSPSLALSPLEKMSLSKIRTCLFRSPTASCSKRTMMRTYSYDETAAPYRWRSQMEISPHSGRTYKRPSEDLLEEEAILKRSRKTSSGLLLDPPPVSARRTSTLTHSPIALQRSLSETRTGPTETHTNLKWAIHRSVTDTDLIGDFSKPCILPLTNGIHPDLKTITSNTLGALLRGEFADRIASYTIVDCRYPYEYEAGHIDGSVNIYNMDLVQQVMLNHLTDTVPRIQLDTDKRNILVFHCEFSWERGPNLSRVLRRLDRACNKEHYPALYYPEIYLLLGGYEKFYSEQKEFCMPQDYKPMKHPNHEEECRFFRSKCKSWQAEKTKGISQTVRANLERFAF